MARKAKPKSQKHSSVNYAEAQRVRALLLSEHVQTLSRRDVQTLVHILNAAYPVPKRQARLAWQPLLVGVGIGLLIVIILAIIF